MSSIDQDPSQGIGLAARVILHLHSLERLGPNDVAQIEHTQQGMVVRLSVRQSSLVRVLQRLLAGDVLHVEARFVIGVNRRMKVYQLTGIGEAAARDLLHRRSGSTAAPPGGSWRTEDARGGPASREADRRGA